MYFPIASKMSVNFSHSFLINLITMHLSQTQTMLNIITQSLCAFKKKTLSILPYKHSTFYGIIIDRYQKNDVCWGKEMKERWSKRCSNHANLIKQLLLSCMIWNWSNHAQFFAFMKLRSFEFYVITQLPIKKLSFETVLFNVVLLVNNINQKYKTV